MKQEKHGNRGERSQASLLAEGGGTRRTRIVTVRLRSTRVTEGVVPPIAPTSDSEELPPSPHREIYCKFSQCAAATPPSTKREAWEVEKNRNVKLQIPRIKPVIFKFHNRLKT